MTPDWLDLDNAEFAWAWKVLTESPGSVFLTGRAGSGKSTFMQYIADNIGKRCVKLAPTGLVATSIGGQTLHSFFRIEPRPLPPDEEATNDPAQMKAMVKLSASKQALIDEVQLIIIDEISMVRCDVLDYIDRFLRIFVRDKAAKRRPFAGKQMLFVGDVFQLPPVAKEQDWQSLKHYYNSPFFFASRVYRELQPAYIELQKVYRQKEQSFLNVLDHVRLGQWTPADVKTLNGRCDPTFVPPAEEPYITVCTTNRSVNHINELEIQRIDAPLVTFEGTARGDFPTQMMVSPPHLNLKVGAQVMFTRNDMGLRNETGQWVRRWCNGTIGIVESIDALEAEPESDEVAHTERSLTVQVQPVLPAGSDPSLIPEATSAEPMGCMVRVTGTEGDEEGLFHVLPEVWENIEYNYNRHEKRMSHKLKGTYTQLPLRQAWAITVHKSQGATFDRVVIDFTSGEAFAEGQTYVALSRCRTLSGMVLRRPITARDILTNAEAKDFVAREKSQASGRRNCEAAAPCGDEASADELLNNAAELYAKLKAGSEGAPLASGIVEALLGAVERNMGLLHDREFRAGLMRGAERLDALQQKVLRLEILTHQFADEYVSLAQEAYDKYGELEAAARNVEKALALAPDNSAAHLLRALLWRDFGYPDAATDSAKRALLFAKCDEDRRRAREFLGIND